MSPDIHTLAGAYVLDAIDSDERPAFEAHLAECETCREEVLALQNAAVELAPMIAPPESLRARVLLAAERTPQLPPLVERPVVSIARRRWAPRMLAAAAAVVLLAGVGITLNLTSDDESGIAVTAAQVFDARDAHSITVPLGDGAVRVAVSKGLDKIAVDGADMPAPPEGHAYQLWLVDGKHSTSLSVMEGDETTAVKTIPTAGVLAVTIEPSGGSERPTTKPIITLDPTSI